MKKIIAVIIAGLIMLQAGTVAYARSQPTVYLHAPSVITSELSEVSVRIKDNSGLMGIKLSVEYPAAQVDVRSIAKGEALNVGDFATDFGEQIGHFQVLWHHTIAVKTNGVLFTFQIQKIADFNCAKIKIAYSREDTFNEKYQNVSLQCNDIELYGTEQKSEQSGSVSEAGAETTLPNPKKGIANEVILKTVEQTLKQQHYASLADVKQKKAFLEAFNANLEKRMGDSSYAMTSFENVQSAYQSAFQGEYIRKIENGMGTAAAQAIISAELKKVQASSVQSVRDRTAFAVAVQQRLISADASLPKMTQNVNTDTVMAILAALYTPQDEVAVDQSNRQKANARSKAPLVVVLLLSGVAIAFLVAWQAKKRKKQR